MPSTPTSPAARASCSACPGGENVLPESNTSKSPSHVSTSVPLGTRSVGVARSARSTARGRADLGTMTNTIPTTSSAASSPSSPSKQNWFASLRYRASHIPMPTSSTTMPTTTVANSTIPTGTISRLFRTPPHGKKEGTIPTSTSDVSPIFTTGFEHQDQGVSRSTLPKLVLPSFDPLSVVGMKYDKETPRKGVQASVTSETRSSGFKVAKYNVKCDVYYPPIPWEPSRTENFENATAALSSYCLNILLSEHHIYSNIILWTSYTPPAEPSRRQQSFTVLPSYLRPDRNALGRDDKYDWAIIAFRDETVGSRVLEAFGGQHGSLKGALAEITAMGYYVDV